MPSASSFPSFDLPQADIWEFLFERPRDEPFPDDKVIYRAVDDSRRYTFAQLKSTAARFGHVLVKTYNWQRGDRLCVFSPNDVDYAPIIFGTLWAGGVVAPANPGYGAKDLAYLLNNADVKVIATQSPLLKVAIEAAKIAGLPQENIVLMGPDGAASQSQPFHLNRLIQNASVAKRPYRLNPDQDLAYLAYSSGTTGLPKGVMLSHRNIIADVLAIKHSVGRNYNWKRDKLLAVLPFFHIYGLTGLLHQPLNRGIETVVMSQFNLEVFCSAIQRYKLTFVYVAPPVIVQLSRAPNIHKYDLSSLRMITSGAAPLTKELVAYVHDKLKLKINQAYGLSETSPMTHTQPWEDWWKTVGSVGKLFPNMTSKIMSEDGQEVTRGQPGELWLKGPNVFKGYLKNEKATKEAITPDGYFKTGDVGYEDEEGNFYCTDRIKELIKWNGFQVAPAELEGLLLDSPLVQDVAVIGVHDEAQHTELPRAYVVPAAGREPSEELGKEIETWLNARVAYYKKLRGGVRFIDAVPKSQAGKILRRVLREMAKEEKTKAKL